MSTKRSIAVTLIAGAGVALLLAGSLVTGAVAAEGGVITKAGWWTRSPAARSPEDGLNVGNGPDGPVSVAAVEVAASTGLSRAVLILTEDGGVQQDSAKLAVCVTPNQWKAGAAQPYGDAPKPECESSGKVEMTRNASSSTWAADVTSLVADIEDEGAVSLMIVPSGAATVPVGFEVRFQKPQLNSEAASTSPAFDDSSFDGGSSSGSSTGSTSSGSGGGFSATDGNSSSSSSNFAPSFDASATAAPVAPNTADGAAGAAATTDSAAAPADTTATTAPAELAALPTQASVGATTGGGNSTVQALFFVLVASLAGAGAGGARWYLRSRNPDTNAYA